MDTVAGIAEHWDDAYRAGDTSRSWFQRHAAQSLKMLDDLSVSPGDSIVDVGGGASTLIDALLARGHRDATVLDISSTGLSTARKRLGPAAAQVHWLVVDVLGWQPDRTYQVWHDRALFHFLTTEDTRQQYLRVLEDAAATGTVSIFATFDLDGPQHCSGLPVTRYSASDLAARLGSGWHMVANEREDHTTPGGRLQPFTWAAFRRH